MSRVNWLNIILMGGGFFLLFTAFQTTAFVQVNMCEDSVWSSGSSKTAAVAFSLISNL